LDIHEIRKKTAEIFFVQLICLDDYKSPEDNLTNFNDENTAKNFIENKINNFYSINTNLNKTNENNDNK
jgi:hypothetical protein